VDLSLSADWRTLDSVTGLASVKQKIRNLAEIVKTNLALELEGKPLRTVSLNRLFLGKYTRDINLYDRILCCYWL
jgi:hypothetical protein